MQWSHLLGHPRKSSQERPQPFHHFTIRKSNTVTSPWPKQNLALDKEHLHHTVSSYYIYIYIPDMKPYAHRHEMLEGTNGSYSVTSSNTIKLLHYWELTCKFLNKVHAILYIKNSFEPLDVCLEIKFSIIHIAYASLKRRTKLVPMYKD